MKTLGILIALLTLFPASMAQNCITVRGTVVDADSGDPLGNCYVYLEGTDYVAQTDKQGTFIVRVPESFCSSILVVWENGYDKYYMPIEKLNGEDVIINLSKIPIHQQDYILWPESSKIQEDAQGFTNITSLTRKSRFSTVF